MPQRDEQYVIIARAQRSGVLLAAHHPPREAFAAALLESLCEGEVRFRVAVRPDVIRAFIKLVRYAPTWEKALEVDIARRLGGQLLQFFIRDDDEGISINLVTFS